jgi:hypothetical protein
LANDPVFWELAIVLADRADRELDQRPTQSDSTSNQPTLQDRIRRMVLLAWCRVPSPAELERLSSFHSSSFEYYRQNPTELEKLGGLHAEQAALAQVARVLLNTDEFVNRD